ncbi:hypothetical protein ABI59_08220 [Acidobacteria bacterium Mor1]|nr:hypothetical protein ABI59_08220 [Acidobacteria bacterium Mor1]
MAKKGKGDKKKSEPLLAQNRAARHNFELLQKFEAGIVLTGTEVKSAREGKVNLKEGYAKLKNGEVFLIGVHFSPYTHGGYDNPDPLRVRKLLLNRHEIRKIAKEVDTGGSGGLTLVPTRMYLKNGRVKVEIAIARGKKSHDKRESKKRQEADREMARARGTRRVADG